MKEVEYEANIISASNIAVRAYYPSKSELETLNYRSKGALD